MNGRYNFFSKGGGGIWGGGGVGVWGGGALICVSVAEHCGSRPLAACLCHSCGNREG